MELLSPIVSLRKLLFLILRYEPRAAYVVARLGYPRELARELEPLAHTSFLISAGVVDITDDKRSISDIVLSLITSDMVRKEVERSGRAFIVER